MPTAEQYKDVSGKHDKDEAKHKMSAQEHRRRLKEARKTGNKKEILRLMKIRELENIVQVYL